MLYYKSSFMWTSANFASKVLGTKSLIGSKSVYIDLLPPLQPKNKKQIIIHSCHETSIQTFPIERHSYTNDAIYAQHDIPLVWVTLSKHSLMISISTKPYPNVSLTISSNQTFSAKAERSLQFMHRLQLIYMSFQAAGKLEHLPNALHNPKQTIPTLWTYRY